MSDNNNRNGAEGAPASRVVSIAGGTINIIGVPNGDVETSDGLTNSVSPTEEVSERQGEESDGLLVSNGNGGTRKRGKFVSRHRQAIDYIRTDSVKATRYPIPIYSAGGTKQKQEATPSEGDDSHDGRAVDQSGWFNQSTVIINRVDKVAVKFWNDFSEKKSADWLDAFFPVCAWLRTYEWKQTFHKDLVAGLTVGVMVIPQAMSYAKLAGLPVEYGLYSALMPVFAYSLFGSSRQLAIGPVAIISLLLATGLDDIMKANGVTEDDPNYTKIYTQAAIQISFLVGVINIAMGILRMGFVTIFLSHAVISGFTSGAAIIIGMSQVKYIFGYNVEQSKKLHEMLANLFKEIENFNWKTFVMGVLSVGLLIVMKNAGKTFPRLKFMRALGPLTVSVVGILLVFVLDLENRGIPIVGFIPEGFPNITVDQWFPIEETNTVFMVSIGIVIVGFMESIAIAKSLASKHKYEIDSSTELIGLGMANFIGSVFQSYPVTGSFSRSAVNHDSGAESGISGMVTATLVAFTLLFLTAVFEKLPLCVLAAIVISGVIGLLDYPEAIYLWKVHKFDFAVWMTAFLGTMFAGVEVGLGIAIIVSLLIVIYESAYPHTSVLGRLPGTTNYRNVKQYPEAEKYDGILMVRIDAPLYFANAQNVRDKIRKYRFQAESLLRENENFEASLKYLILEMAPVSHVDTSALHVLEDMYTTYKSRGQQMCFVNPSLLVMQRMVGSGFVDLVGQEHFFACLHDAVNWCLEDMDQEAMSIRETSIQEAEDDFSGNGVSSDSDVVSG